MRPAFCVGVTVLLLGTLLFAQSPQVLRAYPAASGSAQDPNRPPLPPNRPKLQKPFIVPTGNVMQLSCGPGCGNHTDSDTRLKTYYAYDLATPDLSPFPVVASAGGTIKIITAGMNLISGTPQAGCPVDADPNTPGSQGRIVYIEHGGGWSTYYIHLSSVNFQDGALVKAGDTIGTAGCTGANWIHLHVDLRWYDSTKNVYWTYPAPELLPDTTSPESPLRTDVAFVIDTTGSMIPYIDDVKAASTEIIDDLKTRIPDIRVAVVDFRDFPVRTGYILDYPYRDRLFFTSDTTAAKNAILALDTGYGGDTPETRYCVLMHVINNDQCVFGNPTITGGWRPGASKVIIVLTDAPALSPEPFTNFTNVDVVNAAVAGGFTLIEGGNQDTSENDVKQHLARNTAESGIRVYSVVAGVSTDTVADSQVLADGTGGKVFTATNASEVSEAIIQAIDIIAPSLYLPVISKATP